MEVTPYLEEAHRDVLRRIYLEARRATFQWLDTSTFAACDFDRDTAGESILVLCDQEVVGFSSVWLPDRFLHHLYLDPGLKRNGYGSELLKQTVASVIGPMRLK